MIMPRGQQLLLPVNPLFIVVSLLAALALNMLPLGRPGNPTCSWCCWPSGH